MEFIDLATQYRHLQVRIDKRIKKVLNHGAYIMGPEVFEFEERLAEYVGVKHVISCANGTDALQLIMMVLGVAPGDAVFCPSFTFFATAEAPAFFGAKPVFINSEESTFNICPRDLELQIIKVLDEGRLKPKAIIAVDLFGLPANYPKLKKIADCYGITLIEDAAQGLGGEICGKRAGSFGLMAATSFFPAKPLGCYGDGGAVFTDDDECAGLLRSYRGHGRGVDKYDNVRIGMNSRLDTIQAAILLEKLNVFPEELIAKNKLAQEYSKRLEGRVCTPALPEGFVSSWAQYTLKSSCRDAYVEGLNEVDIPSAIYYRTPLHRQPVFRVEGERERLAATENLSSLVFSIPMHPYMSLTRGSYMDKLVKVFQ